MRVDLEHRIIELEDADFRFDIPLIKGGLPKGQTFLGTVVEAIPVFNIDSYESYQKIRYSDYSFSVYKDGKWLDTWFGHHNLDSECLLDWQVEKVETGYKVINARGFWNNGDIIPFSDIRVLDDNFKMCDGKIITLYIAKRPKINIAEFYGNGSTSMCSTYVSSAGIEPNKAVFEKSPNYYSGVFSLTSCGRSWSFNRGGLATSREDFIQKELKEILRWQTLVTKVCFNGETILEREIA